MKENVGKNKLKLLLGLFIFSLISMGCGYLIFGQSPEKFYDIIAETLTAIKNNKTAEINCFWIILVIGLLVILATYIYEKIKKINKKKEPIISTINGIILGLIITNIIYFIFSSSISVTLTALLFLLIIANTIVPGKEAKVLVNSCFIYYVLNVMFILINCYLFELSVNNNLTILLTFIISLVLLSLEKKYNNLLEKSIILLQGCLPLLLISYLLNRYSYQEQELYLNLPIVAKIFFKVLILTLLITNVIFVIKKLKNNEKDINNIISLSSIISIFVFNTVYNNTSLILPLDLHHSGENILSFQQIFSLGQSPYIEYIPVSGLFSVVTGFILELLGGKLMYYNVSTVIFEMIIAIITILLINKHLNKLETLILAVLFMIPSYNRIYLILISILILMLPSLIKNRNLWLKIWIWVSFLGGLYYPTYGIAVLLGTMPFGVIQIINYIKEEKFKKDIKKVSFYVLWIITLIPIIACLPLLINMAKHTLIYSSQTIYADGTAVFAEPLPANMLEILNFSGSIQKIFFYSIRYIIPMLAVWIFTILLINLFTEKLNKKKVFEILNSQKFLAISSGLIILLISYSYTLIRADALLLLARTGKLLCIICGMLLLIIFFKYLEKTSFSYTIVSIFIGIIMVLNFSSLNGVSNRIFYSYNVPSEYYLIKDSKLPRIGEGFVTSGYYGSLLNQDFSIQDMEKLYNNAQELLSYDNNLKFTLYGCLGTYYIMDLPTIGQPSIHAIKGLEASNELIEMIEKYKPVIGRNIASTEQNYYIYHWLMTTDEYLYSSKYEAFLPKELFIKIFGTDNGDDKKTANLNKYQFNRASAAFGESFDTLKTIFNEVDVEYKKECEFDEFNIYRCDYKFNESLYGDEADFIYLDIDTNRDIYDERAQENLANIDITNADVVVALTWGDIEYVDCLLFKGKLLIEIGANSNWLLNNHEELNVSISGISQDYKLDIKDIKFLKLKIDR